jgi:hypothetical protein
MVLLILLIILGIIGGYLVDKFLKFKKLYNNKILIGLSHLIFGLGLVLLFCGIQLNFFTIDKNGGFMPSDMAVVKKYNLHPKNDKKHANLYGEPRFPQYIDKYYFPPLALIRKELYSLGDLISYIGIFLSLTQILSIAKFRSLRKGYLPKDKYVK